MKYLFTITVIFCSLSLFAQTKGATLLTDNSQPATGQTYAVVVGISDYQQPDIPDLRFADKDAEAFANFLRSPAGGSLDEDHLKVLLNEQATMAQFAIALDWLMEVAAENDRVIIYFSGHGDVEKKTLTQPGFLLCWDAPARIYMAGGAFGLAYLQEVVSTLSVQTRAKTIIITDACRSGKLSGSKVGGAQLTNSNLAKQYANEIKILSCQPDEYSIEGEQWGGGRGAFSFHLLDGLQGMADANADLSVNLKEIGRYLEDRVTEEVAPQNQNPIVIGNKTETLTTVFPEILAQIKAGKQGQIPVFTNTEERGIEEDVLAEADSTIVEQYLAFKESIALKNFLTPEDRCADVYFTQLLQEPQLERLHSSMKRNYAAALQDEAQQVLNSWLKADGRQLGKSYKHQKDEYQYFPRYLQRAAELLGADHYMYRQLKARQLYFEGYILAIENYGSTKEGTKAALSKYKQALAVEPNMPFTHLEMGSLYGLIHQIDSAEYHVQKAISLLPNWILPYTRIVFALTNHQELERAKDYLDQAMQIDSNAYIVHSRYGDYYVTLGRWEEAEKAYKKAIEVDTTYIGPYVNLGKVYTYMKRYEEAEFYINKAIQSDSTQFLFYNFLSHLYLEMGEYEKIEAPALKAIELGGGHFPYCHDILGLGYLNLKRYDEAMPCFEKAIALDPQFEWGAYDLACLYSLKKNKKEAIQWLEKALELRKIPFSTYQSDTNFDHIRDTPEYQALMKQYFPEEWKD